MAENLRVKGCQLRPMSADDYLELGQAIKTNVSGDAFDLIDDADVENHGKNSTIQSLARANVRNYIKLEAPTFNHVLGRSGCTLLAKMLGISSTAWQKILNFTLLYDVNADELVDINDTVPENKYLYGAEIAEHFIEVFDIEKAKMDCLYGAMSDFFSSSARVRDWVTIDKNKTDVPLVAGYYAHFVQGFETVLKRGRTLDNIKNDYYKAIFPNSDSRMSYLLNMAQDKSGLKGMLNYYISVVPSELRPKLDNREHKLTKLYTNVVKASYELRVSNVANKNPKDYASKYRSLENAVKKLQYKNVGTSADVKKDDLSMLERIKSKKGQIRLRNLGKRQDYSGRAVVCINPYLSLDTIRVPKSMLPKLLEYHVLPIIAEKVRERIDAGTRGKDDTPDIYANLKFSDLQSPQAQEAILKIIEEEHLLDKIPIMMGRQPTLHKQSIQGFHAEESDLQAIEVNPLVCPAFNMDFDGDQAHLEVPLSPGAIKEANDLVMTTQNLFLCKNGNITTEPRQDMLYGLYTCTCNDYSVGNVVEVYDTLEDVRQAVMKHKIKVWDTVKVMNSPKLGAIIAGDAAFLACFPEDAVLPRGVKSSDGRPSVEQINSKTISKYVSNMLRTDANNNFIYSIGKGQEAPVNTFVGCINRLVELGFKVARLYPPSLSLLRSYNDIPEYTHANDKFYDNMKDNEMLYNLGFETSDEYQLEFNKHLDELTKVKESNLLSYLGESNGYVKLSVSGARGNMSNLSQAFSLKGRVMKNSTEVFDAVLESSYANQLTPMEHFVDAYGGRQGQIDKSLKTGDTGYAMRKDWHATQGMYVTKTDCGTSNGISISKKFLVSFTDPGQSQEEINKSIQGMFAFAIAGRYPTEDKTISVNADGVKETVRLGRNRIISEHEAELLAKDNNVYSIKIRSPLTCNNPCCQRCYGLDWSTHKPVVVGTSIGINAAHSIGEPATQLTMKQFQKGGVASTGKAAMTSAFDRVDRYVSMASLASLSKANKYPGYDPIAWDTGKIIEGTTSDVTKKTISIGENKKKIVVPKSLVVKEFATKGEGLSYLHGDYDVNELLEYTDFDNARKYLAFKLYSIYSSEAKIKMCHFETLVACMTRYMILDTDRDDLMIGQYCTANELYRKGTSLVNTRFKPALISVKGLPNASNEALDSIIMESQGFGLSRSCLLGLHDSLTKPINRMLLGKTIINGSASAGFIDNRREEI